MAAVSSERVLLMAASSVPNSASLESSAPNSASPAAEIQKSSPARPAANLVVIVGTAATAILGLLRTPPENQMDLASIYEKSWIVLIKPNGMRGTILNRP